MISLSAVTFLVVTNQVFSGKSCQIRQQTADEELNLEFDAFFIMNSVNQATIVKSRVLGVMIFRLHAPTSKFFPAHISHTSVLLAKFSPHPHPHFKGNIRNVFQKTKAI